MMIHNLVKYLVQIRLCLWDIKITNFKPVILSIWFVRKLFFYISQTKSSLNKIFYKVVYHHIIYMCDFFSKFRWLFYYGLHGFLWKLWFPPDIFHNKISDSHDGQLSQNERWQEKPPNERISTASERHGSIISVPRTAKTPMRKLFPIT